MALSIDQARIKIDTHTLTIEALIESDRVFHICTPYYDCEIYACIGETVEIDVFEVIEFAIKRGCIDIRDVVAPNFLGVAPKPSLLSAETLSVWTFPIDNRIQRICLGKYDEFLLAQRETGYGYIKLCVPTLVDYARSIRYAYGT